MAESGNDIGIKIAKTLKIVQIAAIALLIIAVIAEIAKLPIKKSLSYTGVGIVIIAPLIGIIAASVAYYRSKNIKMLVISLIIVIVIIAAMFISK